MWTTILPYILKFFKSKYLYIVLIVVAVCAIQLRITYLKNEVESRNTQLGHYSKSMVL